MQESNPETENQQEMNLISTDPSLLNPNPGMNMKPIVSNNQQGIQTDNPNQPIVTNQVNFKVVLIVIIVKVL